MSRLTGSRTPLATTLLFLSGCSLLAPPSSTDPVITPAIPQCFPITINGQTTSTCSSGGSGGTQSSGDTHPNTALYGLWQGACATKIEIWMSYYKDAVVHWELHYATSGCPGNALYYIEKNGTHAISGDQVDASYFNYLIHIFNTATVANFNSVSLCGISSWAFDTDTPVNGKTCDFSSLGLGSAVTFPTGAVPDYDIFQISGSQVVFGNRSTGNGTTSPTRPTAFDGSNPYLLDPSIIIIPDWAL